MRWLSTGAAGSVPDSSGTRAVSSSIPPRKKPPSAATLIGEARAALANDDARTALVHLLAVWARSPDAELATAIERVGLRAASVLVPPTGLAQLEAYQTNDPVMRHHLLPTTDDAVWLEHLAAEPDPRVTTRVIEIIATPKQKIYQGWAAKWKRVFALLVTAGDPRVVAHLETFRAGWVANMTLDGRDVQVMERRLGEVRKKVIAAHAKLVQLPDDARAPLAALLAACADTGAARRDELLAAIYANPADDAPRAVYADVLAERGGVDALHGELIALQLLPDPTTEQRQRARQLADDHGAHFLGALADQIKPGTVRFERGFVAACHVATNRYNHALEPRPDPAWATVCEIGGWIPASDAHPMPMLTSAYRIDDEDAFVALAKLAKPPPLERLHTGHDMWGDDIVAVIAGLHLPALRRLELSSNRWLGELIPDRLFELHTAELAVNIDPAWLARWYARLADTTVTVAELVISRRPWTPTTPRLILERPDARAPWTLVFACWVGADGPLAYQVSTALHTLPARSFAGVSLDPQLAEQQPALAEAAARLRT